MICFPSHLLMSSFQFDNRQMTEIMFNVFCLTKQFRDFRLSTQNPQALIDYSETKENINRIVFLSICE